MFDNPVAPFQVYLLDLNKIGRPMLMCVFVCMRLCKLWTAVELLTELRSHDDDLHHVLHRDHTLTHIHLTPNIMS